MLCYPLVRWSGRGQFVVSTQTWTTRPHRADLLTQLARLAPLHRHTLEVNIMMLRRPAASTGAKPGTHHLCLGNHSQLRRPCTPAQASANDPAAVDVDHNGNGSYTASSRGVHSTRATSTSSTSSEGQLSRRDPQGRSAAAVTSRQAALDTNSGSGSDAGSIGANGSKAAAPNERHHHSGSNPSSSGSSRSGTGAFSQSATQVSPSPSAKRVVVVGGGWGGFGAALAAAKAGAQVRVPTAVVA